MTNTTQPRITKAQASAIYTLSVSAFPNFTKWEAGFILTLARMRQDRAALSHKQARALGQILNKIRPWCSEMKRCELERAARWQAGKRDRFFARLRRERAG
ncbi:MAG: hypothetical protein HY291_02170 [Planctomycetes bacterium]|nr:hypothetical protein [Planctomycetota bacterium]